MKTGLNFKYHIEEKPETKRETFLLAIQHVFAMFGSTILVPTLIGLDPSVSLVTAGIGTLIYAFITKSKVPVFIGSSFAYIAILSQLNTTVGPSGVSLAVITVGILYIIIALIIKFTGSDWVNKMLPPVVIGPVIIVIGLSLAPVAISNSGFSSDTVNWQANIIAFTSFAVTCVALLKGSKFIKTVPIILGILAGYFIALILGEVDTTLITTTTLINVPDFQIPVLTYNPQFSMAIVASVIPLVFVTLSEHIGDHKVSSSITGKDFIKNPGLKKTLLGDGVATLFAGLMGGPVNTTYAENTGVIILTRVASVYVIKIAAIFAVILAFFGPLTGFITSIPTSVMGGISIILFGLIAQNGFRIMNENKVDLTHPRNMIIVGSILVIGLGGAVLSFTLFGILFSFSNMSLAAIVGIILNAVLPKEKHFEN